MDPTGPFPPPDSETLRLGPGGTSWLGRLTPTWRRRTAVVVAFMIGLACGAGVLWSWRDGSVEATRPAPTPTPTPVVTARENGVRLVLSGVAERTRGEDRGSPGVGGALRIEAALLHNRGTGSATVTRIHRPGGGLTVRASVLPVTLSVNDSYQQISLAITPRDCVLATQWTPSALPLMVTWEDDRGDVHHDLAGDHDRSLELALIRYMEATCRISSAR